jgi:hypothetical protein
VPKVDAVSPQRSTMTGVALVQQVEPAALSREGRSVFPAPLPAREAAHDLGASAAVAVAPPGTIVVERPIVSGLELGRDERSTRAVF